jgi:transposase-like protein
MENSNPVPPKTNGSTLVKLPPAKPGKKRKFDLELKKQIAMRVKSGESLRAISQATGISTSQVKRWSQGEGLGRMGGGHPRPKRGPSGKRASKQPKAVGMSAKARSRIKRSPARTKDNSDQTYLVTRPLKDAVYFLELAETWSYQALRSGELDRLDTAHDHARSALRELKKLTG